MWNSLLPGSSWKMKSNLNGHVTTFGVRRLARWGCWTGNIVDLWDVKQAPEDYWGPGVDVAGHRIMRRNSDGSWQMIGTYTESPEPQHVWTMQIHSYSGRPRAYIITSGLRRSSDTRTAYYTLYQSGIVSSCMTGGEAAAPAWGRNVYWRSRFTFDARGALHAHYEENAGCGAQAACQVEDWTFARDRAGIAQIAVHRAGGQALSLVLRLNKSQHE
jgi:hypothetical protein